ncbi:MAG: hypothetical protein HPY85_03725 [Anaerolineae bacterium]|nr:hypothetical protein [Anaerolineae bacterium]
MKRIFLVIFFLLVSAGFVACSQDSETEPITQELSEHNNNPEEPREYAEVKFRVRVPADTDDGKGVYLHLLDEVTGLPLNPVTYHLTKDQDNVFIANIGIPLHSVIRYRYTLGESVADTELSASGQPVRYRMAAVDQPLSIDDTVAAWGNQVYIGNTGMVQGHVLDSGGFPVGNSLVIIAGMQTRTNTDGSFSFELIPVGTHLLTVYHPEGRYSFFQQQATIGTDLVTPAEIVVGSSSMSRVTLHLTVPDDVFAQLPVRLVGNTPSTGNTLRDLTGGTSIAVDQAPYLAYHGGREYSISIDLPVGFDFRYKYSHGDGFWNAEQSSSSRFPVRQLIVPDHDIDLYDVVESWNTSDKAPLSIITTIPEGTPLDSTVSIQFRPFEWMEPIPMWRIDDQRWLYVLTAPLEYFTGMNYRYCLNGDCDTMPEVNQDGLLIQRKLEITTEPQNIEDVIMGWRQ